MARRKKPRTKAEQNVQPPLPASSSRFGQWLTPVGAVGLFGLGFTMIQVDEFAVAMGCWLAGGAIGVVKAFNWQAHFGRPRWVKYGGIVATTAFVALLAIWTEAKREGHAWSALLPSTGRAEVQDIAIQPLSAPVEYFPALQRNGVKVEMLLHNRSMPSVELENVAGQVWTDSKYLLTTIRRTASPLDHPWTKDGDRREYRIWHPVFSKMSYEWLPTLVFDLPPPGEKAQFGAQLVSKTTDYRQYRWALVNEGGKPVLQGGDATPAQFRKP